MSFQITCPQCGKPAAVPDSAVGKTARCNGCGATFPVVHPDDASEESNESIEILETCENCGRIIGKLESAHLFNQKVVCGDCITRLSHAELISANDDGLRSAPDSRSPVESSENPESKADGKPIPEGWVPSSTLRRISVIVGAVLVGSGIWDLLFSLNHINDRPSKSVDKMFIGITYLWLSCPFFAMGYHYNRTARRTFWLIFGGFVVLWALAAFILNLSGLS